MVLAFALGTLLTGCQPPGSKTEKPLVVGMDLSYPPFETISTDGQPVGVSVDLANALAEYLDRPLRIENVPFVGLIPSLNSGRIDCVISSMTRTDERDQSIDFSDSYLRTGLALLVGKRSPIQSQSDLDQPGRTIVVRQGTTGEVWARSNLKSASILAVEKENAAVLEVIQGKADAFIYDQMSVWTNGRQNPETTRILLDPLQIEEWAIGIREGNTELREQINAFLEEFKKSGGFDRLAEKYLHEQKKDFEKQGVDFVF
ncbi:MAG: transporter substrate-binding domain-containing protein [Terrimicrobiaceae bacterium]